MKSQRNLILTAQTGPGAGSSFVVQEGQSRSFGREPNSSDVAFKADDFMSSKHFQVFNHGDRAELRDLESRNKTWVNNEMVTSAALQDGDKIRAGKTLFLVEWEIIPEIVSVELVDESVLAQSASNRAKPSDGWVDQDTARREDVSRPSPEWSTEKPEWPTEKPEWSTEKQEQESWQPFLDVPDRDHPIPSFEESHTDSMRPPEIAESSKDASVIEWFDVPSSGESLSRRHEPIPETPAPFTDFQPFLEERLTDVSLEESSRAHSSDSARWTRLIKKCRSDGSGLWDLIETLSSQESLLVIAHFKKIGQKTPVTISSTPVFAEIPDNGLLLPVIVTAGDWLKHCDSETTEQLAGSDGLMVVVGRSPESCLAHVKGLADHAFDGFSQQNGFLGWCWPSQLSAMLDASEERCLTDVFGEEIQGLVFRQGSRPWLVAWSTPPLASKLRGFGFD